MACSGNLGIAAAHESEREANSGSCLYLHDASQSPSLLVSAGPEEEMAVSSLSGEVFTVLFPGFRV